MNAGESEGGKRSGFCLPVCFEVWEGDWRDDGRGGKSGRVGSYVNWDAWDERLGEDICWVVGIEVDSSSADRSA